MFVPAARGRDERFPCAVRPFFRMARRVVLQPGVTTAAAVACRFRITRTEGPRLRSARLPHRPGADRACGEQRQRYAGPRRRAASGLAAVERWREETGSDRRRERCPCRPRSVQRCGVPAHGTAMPFHRWTPHPRTKRRSGPKIRTPCHCHGQYGCARRRAGCPRRSSAEALIRAKCLPCHTETEDGISRISHPAQDPGRLAPMSVARMTVHGLKITDEERRAVVKHLTDRQEPGAVRDHRRALRDRRRLDTASGQPGRRSSQMCALPFRCARDTTASPRRREWGIWCISISASSRRPSTRPSATTATGSASR